ncbi:MAG: sigma 54-interacting transcriptional regulator [Syntrophorhabdales bacterium]|jgi:transcriptional regulator with GAF, ATPase, and Fis domain
MDENELFRNVTLQICGSLDMVTGMRRCLPVIEQVIPVDRLAIYIYEKGLGAVRTILLTNHKEGGEVDILIPLPDEIKRMIENPSPSDTLIVTRPDLDPVVVWFANRWLNPVVEEYLLAHAGSSFDSSLLNMTLQIGGKVLGNLALTAEGHDRYTEGHARLLALVHEPFAIALANVLEHEQVRKLKEILDEDNRYLRKELYRLTREEEIVGARSGLKDVMEMVRQISPLDSPVLLLGETGVGKDVIANLIHYASSRKDGPFIKVNCGAIPETLVDSELFGHEKGAFTGATAQKRGFFERAHEGTIFLDEIGELPLAAQVRMLRVIQYKEIQRVGGAASIPVDIRITAATHRNLEEMVRAGRFREDLWFRLNVFPIVVPPLRERKADIPALIDYFIQRKSKELRLPAPVQLASGAIDQLISYDWPGNIRELENVVERALILNKGGPLTFERVLSSDRREQVDAGTSPHGEQRQNLDETISDCIRRTLVLTNGKIHGPGGAAELLGVNPTTLRSRMRKLGIPFKRPQSM